MASLDAHQPRVPRLRLPRGLPSRLAPWSRGRQSPVPTAWAVWRPRVITSEAVAVAALVATAAALVALKVAAAVAVGPPWDTYAFLADAAEFAGRGYGYTELHRPPFLPALTALAVHLGAPLTEATIQWIDGTLALSGVLAFYLLLRRRFAPAWALAGALALLTVPPLWSYVGAGYTDIAAVALSAWLLLVLTRATEHEPRWYLLAGPLLVAAALTRSTALLIVFPACVWVLLRWRPFWQARYLFGAAVLAVLAYVPAAWFYERRFGEVLFPFVIASDIAEKFVTGEARGSAAHQTLFYVRRLPELLGPHWLVVPVTVTLIVAALGLLTGLNLHLRHRRLGTWRLALLCLAFGAALVAQAAGGLYARQLTIAIAVLAAWRLLGPRDAATAERPVARTAASAALDAMMVAWLLAYLDAHEHQAVHDLRYFITMAPGCIYLVVRGWTVLADRARELVRHRDPASAGRRVVAADALAATFVLVVACGLAVTVATTSWQVRPEVAAARASAAWLAAHDPQVRTRTVYSDLWPLMSWYLRANVRPMPFFTAQGAFAHELDKADAAYYVTTQSRRFAAYDEVALTDGAAVLARRPAPTEGLPRIAYLGRSWENYLEQVTGFAFYLDTDAGRYGWEGTAYLDSLSPGELARFDAVAVYGVRWHDRAGGEADLTAYLEDGGCVVIDASSNLGQPGRDLADSVLFDTVIRRAPAPAGARLTVDAAFSRDHPELATPTDGALTAPDGSAWYGAEYSPLPGAEPLTVLARAGDRPVVALRRVGAGRVYFIAYNLVWHAFLTANRAEAQLVSAVFDDAVRHGDLARAQFGDL